MTFSYKNKLYAQIGLLVALMGVNAWGSLFLFGFITRTNATLRDAHKELASLSVRQEQIASLAKEYDGAYELFTPLADRLLSREERLQFIMLVEQLAQEAGVSHEISAGDDVLPVGTAKEFSPLYFNIAVSGSFPNTLRFMYLLEHSRYYLGIEKAQIVLGGLASAKKEGTVSSPDDVKMQLSVRVYTR